MLEIKDIKPPVEVPSNLTWLWAGLLALAVLTLVVAGIVWFLRRPKVKKEIIYPPMPAWEKAYKRLENIQSKNLIGRAYLKPFYTDLCDVLRNYLEEQLSIRAPEMTTEEFLEKIKNSPSLSLAQQEMLKQIMSIADMVKFAQHESDSGEAQKCFDLVKQLIDQTHGT